MIGGFYKTTNRHWKIKEKVLNLRAKGLSYNEIIKKVPVAKSTLSLWCRNIKLTATQKKRLDNNKHLSSLVGIKAIQNMFWGRRCEAFMSGVALSEKLTSKEIRFIAGVMLYWAEGSKSHGRTSIANSDSKVIRFFVSWLKEFFGLNPSQLTIHMHLHSGQDEYKMKRYWSLLTGVPLENFHKSFIKPEGSGYRKNILYNGTVKLSVRAKGSTYLMFKIFGAISGFLNSAIDEPIKPENWMSKLPYAT